MKKSRPLIACHSIYAKRNMKGHFGVHNLTIKTSQPQQKEHLRPFRIVVPRTVWTDNKLLIKTSQNGFKKHLERSVMVDIWVKRARPAGLRRAGHPIRAWSESAFGNRARGSGAGQQPLPRSPTRREERSGVFMQPEVTVDWCMVATTALHLTSPSHTSCNLTPYGYSRFPPHRPLSLFSSLPSTPTYIPGRKHDAYCAAS